ncbi:MAG: hypothetical protein QOE51_2175 [Actinoplanes sp.]|nr:hypothetical protein [Actinoplanes sp.]
MRVRPVSFDVLVEELADQIAGSGAEHVRVAVDGAPAAAPERLADALVDPLRVRGRPAVRILTADFLRPASLRLEFGRENPEAFYAGWLDEAGLTREVLAPAGPGGTGRILRRLWNADTDRSAREPYTELKPGAIVLVSGSLLLGAGLSFDVTVHLQMSIAALRRRSDPRDLWSLPAYVRYEEEVGPATFADMVVRVDDPRHPAMVLDRW